MTKGPKFESEALLCRTFIEEVRRRNGDPRRWNEWIVYPETAGFDILLVRKLDGYQIGIEAKLKLNVTVFCQAAEDSWNYHMGKGVDFRAILIPIDEQHYGLEGLCAHAGITIIRVKHPDDKQYGRNHLEGFSPSLPCTLYGVSGQGHWHELAPTNRMPLPDYVPDVAAGVSSPLQLTAWKVQAIKIAVIMEKRGFVLRSDFKAIGIDHRRWIEPGVQWLTLDRDSGGYVKGDRWPDYKRQHPRAYEDIAADYEKWKPTDLILPAFKRVAQGELKL